MKAYSYRTAAIAAVAAAVFSIAALPPAAAATALQTGPQTTDVSSGMGTFTAWLRLLRR